MKLMRSRVLYRLISFAASLGVCVIAHAQRPKILLTGYWPPTNNMIRSFSPNPAQNPAYIGANWENRGYDIVAYFPEFPGVSCCNWGRGQGDFEVDYQDTASDWARITSDTRPVAIITFSRANGSIVWEMEPAYQRFRLSGETNPPGRSVPFYTADYSVSPEPRFPSDVPIAGEPVGRIRNSSLPMERIVNAVISQMGTTQINPFIAAYDPNNPNAFDFGGAFLSGYIAYLGAWYHDLNAGPTAMFPNYAAGHIHVGTNLPLAVGEQAVRVTLRELIAFLDEIMPRCVADFDDGSGSGTPDGGVTIEDLLYYLGVFDAGDVRADVDDGSSTGTRDGGVTIEDLLYFLARFDAGC